MELSKKLLDVRNQSNPSQSLFMSSLIALCAMKDLTPFFIYGYNMND